MSHLKGTRYLRHVANKVLKYAIFINFRYLRHVTGRKKKTVSDQTEHFVNKGYLLFATCPKTRAFTLIAKFLKNIGSQYFF